ncbi:hypothetical protein KGO95_00740 [Patescibacteria group bacterium]|nr:hypothetical protein [Patescibacteria group bacterium]
MLFRFPKDDKTFSWTSHVKRKMLQYRISEQKIKVILRAPERIEEGIAPDTTASMKRNDTPKRKEELWVMFKKQKKKDKGVAKTVVISTWRYPGVSPKDRAVPIPEDVWEDLKDNL